MIVAGRSEEHTSELQSLMRISYALFCLNRRYPVFPRTDTLCAYTTLFRSGLVVRRGIGADHLDAIFGQRAVVEQGERGVERGLPAHRRQHRVGALPLDDLRDDLWGDRLDIGGVGEVGIGHDRRRVGVDEDDAIALFLQRLDRLRSRIVELARLSDDDRAGAEDADGY